MAPSFDNLADDENFDDVDVDFSGTHTPRYAGKKRSKKKDGNLVEATKERVLTVAQTCASNMRCAWRRVSTPLS